MYIELKFLQWILTYQTHYVTKQTKLELSSEKIDFHNHKCSNLTSFRTLKMRTRSPKPSLHYGQMLYPCEFGSNQPFISWDILHTRKSYAEAKGSRNKMMSPSLRSGDIMVTFVCYRVALPIAYCIRVWHAYKQNIFVLFCFTQNKLI